MQTHEKIGLTIMAAAEGARAGNDIYQHILRVRRMHGDKDNPPARPRWHFDWALCAAICLCAIVPAAFYSSEAFAT
jgi:Uri superfamily endonuclease